MTDAEITKLIATRVMGWTWHQRSAWVDQEEGNEDRGAWECNNRYAYGRYFNPPESIADAWLVVEKLRELDNYVRIELHPSGQWCHVAVWRHGKITNIRSDTAPMAICLAALSAVN